MADCCVSQVGYDVGKCMVIECIWPRIKRHVDYLCCFGDNVRGLRDEIGILEREMINMDQKLEEARLRAESPTTDVENWSEDGAKKLEHAVGILRGCEDHKAWNIISRYSWGRRAKKAAQGIAKLRNEANLIRISNPAPTKAMTLVSHEQAARFESRIRVEEDIMKLLKDDHLCMIAVCGAGGIGKTTMVRRIEDRVREEKLFDEVVHVVVSQQMDMLKIQKEIAELLGLEFSEDTLAGRAHKLRIRLLDSKRKLIIFDDFWKFLKLEDIGVPFEQSCTRCKIILSSRVKDACKKMSAQGIIQMELLTKEEAWTLFKERAGSCIEGPDLRPIAENVAAECKGLPIALVAVGVALKEQSIHVWRDSLSQLRSIPLDFPEVLEDVYKPLKLSYDFLENESVKSFFLLCCMFPEDYNIPIEHLTLYGIGLGMFEGIRNIEEGRSRARSFMEKLKSRFLLLDGGRRNSVKMHDVIRDVGIFIGSKENHGFLQSLELSSADDSSRKKFSRNCNWLSIDISMENANIPVGLGFTNLCLLMIQNSTSSDGNIICFEGMEGLKVLSISGKNFQPFPPTLEMLHELRTLHLHRCAVKDICVVGKLSSLEILCINDCDFIEELPTDIGRLSRLRLLELKQCGRLKRILSGVISSLVGLEELTVVGCFDIKWEAKGNHSEERNFDLSELESLPSLASLQIDLPYCNLLAEEMSLSQKLVRYNINPDSRDLSDAMEHERQIKLYLPGDITARNWIHQLVMSSQSLKLEGDGSNKFNLAEIKGLRNLVIRKCSTVKKLVSAVDCHFFMLVRLELFQLTKLEEIIDGTVPEGSDSFQKLESMEIQYMPKLVHLWKSRNQNVWLGNLKSLSIVGCPNLCYLFSAATARSLVQLQDLAVLDCDKIEQVFRDEMESNIDASMFEFPKLKELTLSNLPNLAAFSQGVEIIETFDQLTELTIKNCPKLRTKIGKCPNLKFADASTFYGLNHLLLHSRHTIKYLFIRNCDIVEEISWDEIKDEGEHHNIIFPELMSLTLCNLSTFCKGVESINFPKLERMRIGNLPRMNGLLPSDVDPVHDHHALHFFCNPKVEIPGLKELYLFELPDTISQIWCGRTPINFFYNLEKLHIADVNGVNCLISSSIAESLVNLKHLTMIRCQEMVDVMEDEKEVFVTTLFGNLKSVFIESSNKLRSFCQWKHALKLPSLTSVGIVDCPGMKTFTLGSLSTPCLSCFRIDNKQVETKDLNDGIHTWSVSNQSILIQLSNM